jgi:hypothetical protein
VQFELYQQGFSWKLRPIRASADMKHVKPGIGQFGDQVGRTEPSPWNAIDEVGDDQGELASESREPGSLP